MSDGDCPGGKRPVTAEDVFRFRLAGAPSLSPDGARVVYTVKTTDREKNRYVSHLRVVNADGSDDRAFTSGEQSDSAPRWSPDGRWIAFSSDRGERTQLWRIRADGGEAEKLTALDEGAIGEFHYSPDGRSIAFTYRPKPADQRKDAVEARKKDHRSTPPMVIRRLHYRGEGEGYFLEERWHLFLLDLETLAVRALTSGPTDQHDLAWSPDSGRIAFVTNRTADPELTPHHQELRLIDVTSGEERPLAAPPGRKSALAWSPDGAWLAYYGNTDLTDVWSARDHHLWVVPSGGGEGRDVSAGLDQAVGDATMSDVRGAAGWTGPTWSTDSRSLYFLANVRGACHLFRAGLDGGEPVNLTPGLKGAVVSYSLDAATRRAAALVCDPLRPGDVEVTELGDGPTAFRKVSATNDSVLAELLLESPEEVEAPTAEGPVHGWLLRPSTVPEGGRAPLILYVHGGPHMQYAWSMLHEFQLLAAHGFAVLYTNPRGSRGYGQAHVDAIQGRWGGPDYRDVMAAVDHAITLPGIDAERLGVTGGSYGGYMTNWVVGHTDRFRCAVTQRSVVNLHSMSGTCDFNFGDSAYFGGRAWDQPDGFLAQSPLMHAGKVRTPLLIIHSEGDLRCPIEQAEQLFAALRRQGREVEFVRYGREANHNLSRGGPPDLRLDRLQRIVGWMERYLRT
jgi:acylaminoacyl-peptidase